MIFESIHGFDCCAKWSKKTQSIIMHRIASKMRALFVVLKWWQIKVCVHEKIDALHFLFASTTFGFGLQTLSHHMSDHSTLLCSKGNSSWTLCAGTYAAQCSMFSSSSNAAGTNSWYMNKEDVMCLKVVKIDSCGSHTTHITDIYWLLAVRENFQTKWGWCKHRSVNDRKMANMRDQTKAICKILWIFIWGLVR